VFRNYFVSECFRHGVPEAQIMDWVGHRDSKVVALYRHASREDGRRMMSGVSFFEARAAPDVPRPVAGSVHEKGDARDDEHGAAGDAA
jgi:hypothetical protein